MLFRKKKPQPRTYDREALTPVIRCSICTGEEVAGFRNLQTGHFTEVRLLRGSEDLQQFMEEYGITREPPREY